MSQPLSDPPQRISSPGRRTTTMATTYRHRIRLRGSGATGTKISGALLRDLLDVLVDGCRGAVRMRLEGRSSAPGTSSGWLAQAADFELLPLESGSTVIPIEVAPLAESAPGRFAQFNFLEVDPCRSALSLFEESLEQALRGNEEAELFDQPLLQRFTRLSRVLSDGVQTVEITSNEPEAEALTIEASRLGCVEQLLRQTPSPQRTRLAGKLDTIRHSDRMFTLILQTGESIKGVAEGVAAEQLAALFGTDVLVNGRVAFLPSGKVLRVEADRLAPAEGDLEPWSRAPRPLLSNVELRSLVAEQGRHPV